MLLRGAGGQRSRLVGDGGDSEGSKLVRYVSMERGEMMMSKEIKKGGSKRGTVAQARRGMHERRPHTA